MPLQLYKRAAPAHWELRGAAQAAAGFLLSASAAVYATGVPGPVCSGETLSLELADQTVTVRKFNRRRDGPRDGEGTDASHARGAVSEASETS